MSDIPGVIRMADVKITQPTPPENWREMMTNYIDALECPEDYELNVQQYYRAKRDLLKFIPFSHYDEMLQLLIKKMGL